MNQQNLFTKMKNEETFNLAVINNKFEHNKLLHTFSKVLVFRSYIVVCIS